ncbi:putative isomerase YbhE [Auriculariales sp. MPI-PUGE-AT-0066]|nr:putative isomerase YbhE [Auriculariales sp. MPI-PUGE-AT-0066]
MVNFTVLASGYAAAISAFNFDSTTGKLSLLSTTPNQNSDSWLETSAGHKALFSAAESGPGGVESFTIGADGSLTSVSHTDSGGIPVSLAVLSNGKEVVTANYDNGQVVSFPIEVDGVTLGEGIFGVKLEGSGPVSDRQDGSHPHHIVEYQNEVLISDLGTDKVWRLTKDASGAYQVAGQVDQAPGSGPRHIAAKDGKLFVLHELDNSLSYYTLPELPAAKPLSAKFRKLRRRCTASTTTIPPTETSTPENPSSSSTSSTPTSTEPESPTMAPPGPVTPQPGDDSGPALVGNFSVLPTDPPAGAVWGAGELLLTQDGQYLYASNRNIGTTDERGDPIAIFSVDPFALVDHVYTGVTHIRGMMIGGPNDEYLIAAGMNAGGIVIYERGTDGNLKELDRYTGEGSEKVATFTWL